MTVSAFLWLYEVHFLVAANALAMVGSEQPRPVNVLGIKRDRMAVPAKGRLILFGFCLSFTLMMATPAYCINASMERN
jgi:hypothetical protein